jgi:glycyl-tRNA synthetase beta chain
VKQGMPEYEILQAVIKTRSDDLADVFSRYQKVIDLGRTDKAAFISSIQIVQRISNILKSSKDQVHGWNQTSLREEKEISLAGVFQAMKGGFEAAFQKGDLNKANELYAKELTQPVMDFFEKIMVNAEDAEIRKNRLGLLTEIRNLYTQNIADLSLLSRIEE